MTTLTPILAAVDQLRQQLQDVKLDHPWDQRTRERALERLSDVRADLSAVWSDVSVAEKRQGEDQPRVTYDPATDQAVPCCCPLGEPDSYTISESCESLDREAEQAQQAAVLAASVLTNPTPETQKAWAELRDSCDISPESVTITMADGTSRLLTDEEREQLFRDDESLRDPVVSRATTETETVIDREDGTRTTVSLDGSVAIDSAPITEALMRAAQVGWVVRTKGGHVGKVAYIYDCNFDVQYLAKCLLYEHRHAGKCLPERFADYDIVSLTPPDVVAELDEVLK